MEALIQTFPKLWGRLKARLSFVSYSLWGWEMKEHNINCIYHITAACLNQPTRPALTYTAGQTSPKLIKAYQTSERLISGTLQMYFQVPPWIKKCKWFYRKREFLTYIYIFQPRHILWVSLLNNFLGEGGWQDDALISGNNQIKGWHETRVHPLRISGWQEGHTSISSLTIWKGHLPFNGASHALALFCWQRINICKLVLLSSSLTKL